MKLRDNKNRKVPVMPDEWVDWMEIICSVERVVEKLYDTSSSNKQMISCDDALPYAAEEVVEA